MIDLLSKRISNLNEITEILSERIDVINERIDNMMDYFNKKSGG